MLDQQGHRSGAQAGTGGNRPAEPGRGELQGFFFFFNAII